jgi:hypothetical protein
MRGAVATPHAAHSPGRQQPDAPSRHAQTPFGRMIGPRRHTAMTADQLIAEAAGNRPPDPPPSLDNVERGLHQLLETMLSAFDYRAQFGSGATRACRVHALLIAEVQALRRTHAH